MKKTVLTTAAAACVIIAFSASAAKPVKITPGPKGSADGQTFRNYVVQCSDGKKQPLTSWKSGKQWCVGQDSRDNCTKKQIRAAQKACRLN